MTRFLNKAVARRGKKSVWEFGQVVIPYNEAQRHWNLVVVSTDSMTYSFIDSLPHKQKITNNLKVILDRIFQDYSAKFPRDEWKSSGRLVQAPR